MILGLSITIRSQAEGAGQRPLCTMMADHAGTTSTTSVAAATACLLVPDAAGDLRIYETCKIIHVLRAWAGRARSC